MNPHLRLDEWHLPICYQNPLFSWDHACTKSGMCWFSVVPLIENSDGWASYRICLFLWTFPFECALEYGTIVITFISVVCQHIWCNVLPLFFPRYTGVKKTQHYKLFISNSIVLFWRTKKNTNSNITGRTVSALPTEEFLEKGYMKRDQRKKRYFYKICRF
jgi:hypothetical protein